jgi:hypothetical protein
VADLKKVSDKSKTLKEKVGEREKIFSRNPFFGFWIYGVWMVALCAWLKLGRESESEERREKTEEGRKAEKGSG